MSNFSVFQKLLYTLLLSFIASHQALAVCDTPPYRVFDFWIGEWEVKTPDGKLVGTNSIKSEYDNCVIHERYSAISGYTGESLNTYDPNRKVWHQTWVDNSGALLLLEGNLVNGEMILEGQTLNNDGKTIKHRITWTANKDSSVRQLWESTDSKGTMTVVFDGLYTKK